MVSKECLKKFSIVGISFGLVISPLTTTYAEEESKGNPEAPNAESMPMEEGAAAPSADPMEGSMPPDTEPREEPDSPGADPMIDDSMSPSADPMNDPSMPDVDTSPSEGDGLPGENEAGFGDGGDPLPQEGQ